MYIDKKPGFYYITVGNENYAQPAMPEGAGPGILKGMYKLSSSELAKPRAKVQLLGSGAILNEVVKAKEILESDYGVAADVWSVTSYKELRKEAKLVERDNMLHPESTKVPYVTQCLQPQKGEKPGVVVAASDYMKILPDSIARWIPRPLVSLGTDGFGRSDTRRGLRNHFEVDSRWVVIAALSRLVREGELEAKTFHEAVQKLNIDLDKIEPSMA
jgi:pyruvate dehydrogenase E1 component